MTDPQVHEDLALLSQACERLIEELATQEDRMNALESRIETLEDPNGDAPTYFELTEEQRLAIDDDLRRMFKQALEAHATPFVGLGPNPSEHTQ